MQTNPDVNVKPKKPYGRGIPVSGNRNRYNAATWQAVKKSAQKVFMPNVLEPQSYTAIYQAFEATTKYGNAEQAWKKVEAQTGVNWLVAKNRVYHLGPEKDNKKVKTQQQALQILFF